MQSYRKIDRFTAVFVFGRETVGFAGAGRLSRFAQQPRSGLTLTDWKRPHAQGKGAGKGRRPPLLPEPSAARLGVWGQSPRIPSGRSRVPHRGASRTFFPLTGWPPQGGRGGVVFGGRKLGFFAQIFGVRRRHAEYLFLVYSCCKNRT